MQLLGPGESGGIGLFSTALKQRRQSRFLGSVSRRPRRLRKGRYVHRSFAASSDTALSWSRLGLGIFAQWQKAGPCGCALAEARSAAGAFPLRVAGALLPHKKKGEPDSPARP